MLTTLVLIICSTFVLVMMPLMVQQLVAGPPPTPTGFTRKFHLAQPWLNVIGNLFVLSVCFIALNRLGEHLGWIAADRALRVDDVLHYPFFALFAVYGALWLHAFILVKTSHEAA